jgi:predicted esterase
MVQHGRHDDVVPDFFAEDVATALGAAGAQVTTDWRDMGHERTDESVAALAEWIGPLAGSEV